MLSARSGTSGFRAFGILKASALGFRQDMLVAVGFGCRLDPGDNLLERWHQKASTSDRSGSRKQLQAQLYNPSNWGLLLNVHDTAPHIMVQIVMRVPS